MQTHFGFETIPAQEKKKRVRAVFDSVAPHYDLMNDTMSLGLHRLWKSYQVLVANIGPHHRILDIASGTGDVALAMAKKIGPSGQVIHTDINLAMLKQGRNRLLDTGFTLPSVLCNAESLPFASESFDRVTVSFGLRNMTDKLKALTEMHRVLKPGGKLLVLEFSQIAKPLRKLYDFYSFEVLPRMGSLLAGDSTSYRYLAESIRVHPNQETLKTMMHEAGFGHVDYHNLCAGITALHVGIRC